MDVQMIGLAMLFLIAAGEILGFAYIIKAASISAIQRAIFTSTSHEHEQR